MKAQCKKIIFPLSLICCALVLTGCEKYYLSLTQQNVDVNYLASTHVKTPDPRQAHPPTGEMIIIGWRIPKKILREKPTIDLHVIYWNYTEKVFHYPIKSRMGYVKYQDLDEEFASTQGILTYKADIRTEEGMIYKEWKHQLWVNLITPEENKKPIEHAPFPPSSIPAPKEEDDESCAQNDEEEDFFSYDEGIEEQMEEATDEISSSVDDQSIQGSVMETDDRTEDEPSDKL